MKISYAAICEAGSREENQDSIFCASHEGGGVFLVADGMGGHENGRIAGQTVREEIQRAWEECTVRSLEKMHSFLLDETLKEALNAANKRIRKETGEGKVSGSTAVVLRIGGDGYGLLSCGDSRCLKVQKTFCGTEIRQLTEDDVWENCGENTKGLSRDEIRVHANRGKLVRAVGTETGFDCDVFRDRLSGRTLFALCSDGVYKYLDGKVFADYLKETYRRKGTEELLMDRIERIRGLIYENGAPDNFSLILVLAEPES